MDLAEYKMQLEQLTYGKRLHTAVYLYHEPGTTFGQAIDSLLAGIIAIERYQFQITPDFNVIKFRTDELKLSFLVYPDFMSNAHPALRHAITVDLVTGKARHTDYSSNLNPPILHRKEAFLPTDHKSRPAFAALTAAEEGAGLYANTSTIGFKLNWERLLQSKGLAITGHTLTNSPTDGPQDEPAADPTLASVVVARHKTALTRYDLSKPVKTLLEYGILRTGRTFFDYGCGQGSDVRGLQALGHQADGWDPVFWSDAGKKEADLVNLGYVLNVIEDPAERLEALVDAYRHARRVLVVSARRLRRPRLASRCSSRRALA